MCTGSWYLASLLLHRKHSSVARNYALSCSLFLSVSLFVCLSTGLPFHWTCNWSWSISSVPTHPPFNCWSVVYAFYGCTFCVVNNIPSRPLSDFRLHTFACMYMQSVCWSTACLFVHGHSAALEHSVASISLSCLPIPSCSTPLPLPPICLPHGTHQLFAHFSKPKINLWSN